jgi:copper chaperone CopZ
VSVAVKKLNGVQSVNVSLNKGLVTIELAAGNYLTMGELRRVIITNGFSPKEATVVVDGVVEDGDKPTLNSDATHERFVLTAMPNASAAFDDAKRAAHGIHVEMGGRLDVPKGPEQLAVASVRRLP